MSYSICMCGKCHRLYCRGRIGYNECRHTTGLLEIDVVREGEYKISERFRNSFLYDEICNLHL